MPRNPLHLPDHWKVYADTGTAVRSDGARVVRDRRFVVNSLVIENNRGEVYSQSVRGQHSRPRLFKYLDAAAATADRIWPLGEQHELAFRLVADPDDWKKPIDAIVPANRLTDVVKAIQFYTATETTVSVLADGQFRVKSIGYRMGPAGP
jgi:hypothetical protein